VESSPEGVRAGAILTSLLPKTDMKGFPLAAAVAVLACVPALAGGQTLGEIARRIEKNKKAAPPPARFDERDVNAAAARRELLEFRLEAPVWERFLTADRRVAVALAHDPSLLERLEGLNHTTLRSVGHFVKRGPAIAAALKEAGVDPHDYATVYLAMKLAFSREPYALSPAVQLNLVFLKTRTPDVEGLAVPLEKLSAWTFLTRQRGSRLIVSHHESAQARQLEARLDETAGRR
jgi:hypothetical protein